MDSQKSILITLFFIIIIVNLTNSVHVNAIGSPLANPNSLSCMDLMMNNMASCVTFLSKGSTVSKPDPNCCSGLKVVLGVNAECLCEALKSSGSFGIQIDFGRAAALPSSCNIQNAPPISKCNGPSSSSSPPSEQDDPNKNKPATPMGQPIPPPATPTKGRPSPIKSKMGPSSSPSATSTLGPSYSPPTTPKMGSSSSPPPASSTTGPSPSFSSLAPSKIPPMGSSSPLPETPIATTTMVPLPSPSSDDTTTTTSHPPSSSSVSIIIPYVMIASCNIFLHFFA